MPPQPAKKRDWSSFAASLIPAVVGGIAGGPMGAAAGFGKGIGDISEQRMELEKYNREQALKEEAEARKQQQIDINRQQMGIYEEQEDRLERQRLQEIETGKVEQRQKQEQLDINRRYAITGEKRLGFEKGRQVTLDKQIDQAIAYQKSQTELFDLQVTNAQRTREARDELRVNMTPEQRVIFDADPEGGIARKREDIRLLGAGPILEGIVKDIPKGQGQHVANMMRPDALGKFYETYFTAKSKPQKAYTMVMSPGDGGGFLVDQTGKQKPVWYDFQGAAPGSTKNEIGIMTKIRADAFKEVTRPYKIGQMGQFDFQDLGQDDAQRQARLKAMTDKREIELASMRGVAHLYARAAPDMLLEMVSQGQITKGSDAIMYHLPGVQEIGARLEGQHYRRKPGNGLGIHRVHPGYSVKQYRFHGHRNQFFHFAGLQRHLAAGIR